MTKKNKEMTTVCDIRVFCVHRNNTDGQRCAVLIVVCINWILYTRTCMIGKTDFRTVLCLLVSSTKKTVYDKKI